MFPTGIHLLQGEEMVPNELSPLHAKAVDVRDSVPNSPAIQYTLRCPYYWVVGLEAWHCSGSEAPLCHHYVLSLTHRGILSLIHRQSTCPPGDFAGIEILGRGHVIQTCCWLPQMFVAAAFGAKLWSCEYRQVVENGYVCARVRALVNHLGFAIEITYTPMHNIYVHNMCLWFIPCISTTSSHATWSLQFFWVEKNQIFLFKKTLRSQLFMDTWHLGSNPGDLGSPWVTMGHLGSPSSTTWYFPWFPYPASTILIHPIHPWQVGLGTCQWFRTGGPSSGAEDDSTSDRWRWIWARKVQLAEKSGCLGQLKDRIRSDVLKLSGLH